MATQSEPGPVFREIDFGEDVGWVKFKLGGKELVVCPYYEMEHLRDFVGEGAMKGAKFLDSLVNYLSTVHGVTVSPVLAYQWYETVAECEQEIGRFFGQRLSSSGNSAQHADTLVLADEERTSQP